MKIIDKFLQEDMLVVRPAIFIYIDKEKCQDLVNKGIILDKPYISCYLKRLPDNSQYQGFLEKCAPVRITLHALRKIKDQKVVLKCVNISSIPEDEIKLTQDHLILQLQRKYANYLNTCYKDNVPLENLPRIDLYLEKHYLPGFVCKILK